MRGRRPSPARRLFGYSVLTATLVGAGALGTWYFRPDLRPSWLPFDVPSAPSATVTLYRWQNEEGQWVVSDQPPPEGVEYETVTTRHDTNVMPAFESEG